MTTIKEIVQKAGFSTATVSRILNDDASMCNDTETSLYQNKNKVPKVNN